jgi:hypothetical protein
MTLGVGPTVLVFVKAPVPGAVKSRLARVVGAEKAAELYRQWIGQVLTALQPLRLVARVVGYYAGGSADRFAPWRHLADEWWPQPEGDLGERLDFGFRIANGHGQPVIAVGTDCLELDATLVLQAIESLQSHDAVFGPAADGGYYLVGTARLLPGFFRSVRWSSPFTLTDHLRSCYIQRWSVAFLARRHDIDTWNDWQGYLQRAAPQEG